MKSAPPLFLIATSLFCTGILPSSAVSYLSSGHTDTIGIGWDGESLVPHHHVDIGAVVDGVTLTVKTDYAPEDLVVVAGISAYQTIPSGFNPSYAAKMGVIPGDGLSILPESQQPGLPFAGLSSESLNPADWPVDFIISLVSVSGPGEFSMWQSGSFGALNFLISTADGGITAEDRLTARAGSHIHYNWGFTQPGTYEVTFEITGTHITAGQQSTTATYTFLVVPEPSAITCAGVAGGLLLLRRRRINA